MGSVGGKRKDNNGATGYARGALGAGAGLRSLYRSKGITLTSRCPLVLACVKRGTYCSVLKVPHGPPGQEGWVGAEQQNGQIRGAAPVSFSVYVSTCPFLSVSLSFIAVFLSLFLSMCVPLSFSAFPASLPMSLSLSLSLFLHFCLCVCVSLSISFCLTLSWPALTLQAKLFCSSLQVPLVLLLPLHTSSPFVPCRGSGEASEAPASHHIQSKCLIIRDSRITQEPTPNFCKGAIWVPPGQAPTHLAWPTQVAGQNVKTGLSFEVTVHFSEKKAWLDQPCDTPTPRSCVAMVGGQS